MTTSTIGFGTATRGVGPPARLLVVVGTCCVVLGGLVAAVTGPLELADGSWLAAYLVLVGGVAQCAFGHVPSRLAVPPSRSPRQAWTQLVCWNVGNAGVVTGTLVELPAVVDAGAVPLVVGIGIAWHAIRRTTAPSGTAQIVGWAYRILLLLLLVSVPVGVVLAHLRAPV